MPAIRPVTVDLAAGVVTIGGTRVALEREGVCFTAAGGFRARALNFAERSSIVAGALIDPDPHRALLDKLRVAAAPSCNTANKMNDALIIALAGGGESAASYPECAREACRKRGVDWLIMQQTPAILVDRFACEEDELTDHDGWIRFEFRETPRDYQSIEDCCRLMLERLLQRGIAQDGSKDAISVGAPESFSSPRIMENPHDSEADSLSESAGVNGRPQRRATDWPRAVAQMPHARAVLLPNSERFKLLQETKIKAPVALCFPPVTGWPESPCSQPGQNVRHSPEDLSGDKSLSGVAGNLASKGAERVTPPSTSGKTIGNAGAEHSIATAAVTRSAVDPAAIPAKPGLRPHRRRDLPVPAAQRNRVPEAILQSRPPTAEVTATAMDLTLNAQSLPAFARAGCNLPDGFPERTPRHDWIYELATALADECDLRGLDR